MVASTSLDSTCDAGHLAQMVSVESVVPVVAVQSVRALISFGAPPGLSPSVGLARC